MEVSNMWKCLWQVFHFYQMSSQKNEKCVFESYFLEFVAKIFYFISLSVHFKVKIDRDDYYLASEEVT